MLKAKIKSFNEYFEMYDTIVAHINRVYRGLPVFSLKIKWKKKAFALAEKFSSAHFTGTILYSNAN